MWYRNEELETPDESDGPDESDSQETPKFFRFKDGDGDTMCILKLDSIENIRFVWTDRRYSQLRVNGEVIFEINVPYNTHRELQVQFERLCDLLERI